MKKISFLLAMVLTAQRLPAQMAGNSSFAPMHVQVNGAGHIYPAHDGEMLRVGRKYTMTAIPARGYKFASWQPANFITSTIIEQDQNGNLVTNELVQAFPLNEYYMEPVLTFRVLPATSIPAGTGESITKSEGWQVNFVPKNERVPKPPRDEILNNPNLR